MPAMDGPTRVSAFLNEWQVTQPGEPADAMTGSLNSFLPVSTLPAALAAGWLLVAGLLPPPHADKAKAATTNTRIRKKILRLSIRGFSPFGCAFARELRDAGPGSQAGFTWALLYTKRWKRKMHNP